MVPVRKRSVLRNKRYLPLAGVVSICCSGCSRAPSVDVLGSFLPSWMLCISLGVAAAGLVRWLLVHYRLEKRVSFLVLFYPSLVVVVACMVWLAFFR